MITYRAITSLQLIDLMRWCWGAADTLYEEIVSEDMHGSCPEYSLLC